MVIHGRPFQGDSPAVMPLRRASVSRVLACGELPSFISHRVSADLIFSRCCGSHKLTQRYPFFYMVMSPAHILAGLAERPLFNIADSEAPLSTVSNPFRHNPGPLLWTESYLLLYMPVEATPARTLNVVACYLYSWILLYIK